MPEVRKKRIVCLSNVYDHHYQDLRHEEFETCLSAPKRRDLFECWERATGREVLVLTCPPRSTERRRPRWLPAVDTQFGNYRQFVAPNWDAPKLRIPLSWFFFAWHVLRHSRSGDLLVLDNFEFIHVVAAYVVRIFRRVQFVLDYEDGKHLIESGVFKAMALTAERAGRPLIRAALIVASGMKTRLPLGLPTLLIPGFVVPRIPSGQRPLSGDIRFLYSGSLDRTRGVDLLLDALQELPENGWTLDITGGGPLAEHVADVARLPRWSRRLIFHGVLRGADYGKLLEAAHVGLNCQRASDPISEVTFPSKLFSYFSAGLIVLSSEAGDVRRICGDGCVYYQKESSTSLAAAMRTIIGDWEGTKRRVDTKSIFQRYSIEGTAERMAEWIRTSGLIS